MPAGHRGDQQRGAELFAKQADASVDRIEVGLGERLMYEAHAFEEGSAVPKRDLVGRAQIQMIGLSLLNICGHRIACSAASCRVRSSE